MVPAFTRGAGAVAAAAGGGDDEVLAREERLADIITDLSGRMYFIYFHALWFTIWIVINLGWFGFTPFDPFPFGLLTMIVSLEAIFLATFVLISQNRQAEKDRVRSDIEYEINIKAELEIAHSFAEAAKSYQHNPTALHLRAMNMLYEGLKEKGALMLVPSTAVESMGMGGLLGAAALQQSRLAGGDGGTK